METQLESAGVTGWRVQCKEPYRLSTEDNPRSRPRADFCWDEERLVVEVEGGTWTGGKYTSGSGYSKTCRKHNYAVRDGWAILRVTTDMIHGKSKEALHTIQRTLEVRRNVKQEDPVCQDPNT